MCLKKGMRLKMEECKIKNLYNLEETIAAKIFEGATYPWEVLPKISEFIIDMLDPKYRGTGNKGWKIIDDT